MPSFLSLYSGAGGLDLGAAAAGLTATLSIEIDPAAADTLRGLHSLRHPDWAEAAANLRRGDVVTADVEDALGSLHRGMADVLIGGPPCQGFSSAGRMDPSDPRSRHVHRFLDAVDAVRPSAFVMENVPDLARREKWAPVLSALVSRADDLGYDTTILVLNAADYQAGTRRERMFFIGSITGRLPATPPPSPTPVTVRDVLDALPDYLAPGNGTTSSARIVPSKNPILRNSHHAGMLFNGRGRILDLARPAPTLPASMGGNHTPIVDERARAGEPSWAEDYLDRLRAGHEPVRAVPEEAGLRRITVEEAAALQSFPAGMKWSGSTAARYRQIGNAVPPLLARAIMMEVTAIVRG